MGDNRRNNVQDDPVFAYARELEAQMEARQASELAAKQRDQQLGTGLSFSNDQRQKDTRNAYARELREQMETKKRMELEARQTEER